MLTQDRTIDLTHLGGIKFEEEKHRYSNIDNVTYTGITTLLHKYCEPFDVDRISMNKAIKNIIIAEYGQENFDKLKKQVYKEQLDNFREKFYGDDLNEKLKYLIGHDYLYTKTEALRKKKPSTYEKVIKEQERLKIEWQETSTQSSTEGTIEHDKREQDIKANGYTFNGKFFEYNPDKNILNVTVNDRIVIPECLVWNHDLMLGGLADIFLFDKGKIIVQDYKTNAKIEYESFKRKKMLGVCKRLMDTNFSHYSLQLRIYQEMAIRLRPEFKKGSNTIILTSSVRHGRENDELIECCKVEKEVNDIFDELKNK